MATSTPIKHKKVKIRKTAAQVEAERLAEEAAEAAAQQAEWNEYVGELITSIDSGDLDFALENVAQHITDRLTALTDDEDWVQQIEASTTPDTVDRDTITPGTRLLSKYDLVGKVVYLNRQITPRWLAGMRIRVVRVNRTGVRATWVDDPKAMGSTSKLAQAQFFRCPFALLDVVLSA